MTTGCLHVRLRVKWIVCGLATLLFFVGVKLRNAVQCEASLAQWPTHTADIHYKPYAPLSRDRPLDNDFLTAIEGARSGVGSLPERF